MNYVRHCTDGYVVEWTAYSPPFALFTPKLLPTTPLQRQDWPAALVHDAVAVAPTFRQDIARLSRAGDAETRVAKRAARERLRKCMMDCRPEKILVDQRELGDCTWGAPSFVTCCGAYIKDLS
jgi:hypothetical protein